MLEEQHVTEEQFLLDKQSLKTIAMEGIAVAGGAACNKGSAVNDEQSLETTMEGKAAAGGAAPV